MTSAPRTISVLIPAYNEAALLGKCLETLIRIRSAHPEFDIQIIVCDNNSTDDTAKIAASYPEVTVVSETKPGANAARQKAFLASTGDIVATLDADSYPAPGWIERALPHFNNEKVVAVSGVYKFDSGWFTGILNILQTKIGIPAVHFIAHNVLQKAGFMVGGNAWYRRSSLEKIGGFNTDIEFFGDDAHTAKMLTRIGKIDLDTKVVVISSARRFEKDGFLTVLWQYIINYVWMWLFKKPYHAKHNNIRD